MVEAVQLNFFLLILQVSIEKSLTGPLRPLALGRSGPVKLFSIDLTGFNEREIITPNEASDPAWSPLNN